MTTKLEKELYAARENLKQQQEKTNRLAKEVRELQLAVDKEEYNCSCVKLNGDIEIYDIHEQSRRGRIALTLGLVADTFSARLDCPYCKGTGDPKK